MNQSFQEWLEELDRDQVRQIIQRTVYSQLVNPTGVAEVAAELGDDRDPQKVFSVMITNAVMVALFDPDHRPVTATNAGKLPIVREADSDA